MRTAFADRPCVDDHDALAGCRIVGSVAQTGWSQLHSGGAMEADADEP